MIEINPACVNVTCSNGGSCIHINETNDLACDCTFEFTGEFCQGIISIHWIELPGISAYHLSS